MHRYQSRFLYQRSPFGSDRDYYTLGSLSNKPGKDWSTPRYIRDEPDRFMSGYGYGEGEDDIPPETGYDIPPAPPEDFGPPSDLNQPESFGPPSDLSRPLTEEEKAAGAAAAEEQKPFWETSTGKFLESTGKSLLDVGAKIGVQLATDAAGRLVNAVTGQLIPPSAIAAATGAPAPTAPIPVEPVMISGMMSTDWIVATLYHSLKNNPTKQAQVLATMTDAQRRLAGLPPRSSGVGSNTLLLVGAAAVAAFLLLRK